MNIFPTYQLNTTMISEMSHMPINCDKEEKQFFAFRIIPSINILYKKVPSHKMLWHLKLNGVYWKEEPE